MFGSSNANSEGLFKNGRRVSGSEPESRKPDPAHHVEQSPKEPEADDASSVASLEIPLEEPEPEMPKRKIIRVTKPVKLRDFTNEEKGEEDNEEEKQLEKEKDKEAMKPRGWKTENDEGNIN